MYNQWLMGVYKSLVLYVIPGGKDPSKHKQLVKIKHAVTIFPQNLAAARFYFKAQFGAATIWGWLDFEGGIYWDWHACAYTASIVSLFICMYNERVHTYLCLAILYHAARFWGPCLLERVHRNMQQHFEGGGILMCSEILGNTVLIELQCASSIEIMELLQLCACSIFNY